MLKNITILFFVFTLFGCKNKEQLLISQIDISLDKDKPLQDSIQSTLSIYIKPQNEDIFFPSHLIFKDSKDEYKVYLNSFNPQSYLKSSLLYHIEYKKIESEKDFEKLKSQVIQLEFYLPNGQKLKRTANFQIKKSSFEYVNPLHM